MITKLVKDTRLDAWLRGWNDGATAKESKPPRAHADEYGRGYQQGHAALLDHYAVAKARISGGTR